MDIEVKNLMTKEILLINVFITFSYQLVRHMAVQKIACIMYANCAWYSTKCAIFTRLV
jgi:hypothetical protein